MSATAFVAPVTILIQAKLKVPICKMHGFTPTLWQSNLASVRRIGIAVGLYLPVLRSKKMGGGFHLRHNPEQGTGTVKTISKNAFLRAGVAPAILGFALFSGTAFSQETATEEAPGDVIVVTGSRIQSPNAISVAPVQVIGAEQIQNAGVPNLQDILLKNPTFGAPTFSRTNTGFSTNGAGAATVDLRNLGIDRTLVLINGRRVVSGIPGSPAVDLNTIPAQFIERVDVLTGGTSAVYGSDAVAGVVNIIYKSDFQGVEIGGQYGITSRGDGAEKQLNMTLGGNFGDNRGNVMLYLGYTKQNKIFTKDRSTEAGSMAIDEESLGAAVTGRDEDLFTPIRPFYSGYNPRGRYYTDNYTWTYDPTSGALRPCTSTNGGIAPATCGAFAGQQIGPDGYNRSDQRVFAVPVERYLAAFKGNYEVSDSVNLFMEGTYASTSSATNIEPFPFDSTYITDSGQVPIETRVNGAIVRNPYVPDAIYADASDTDGDGLRDIFFDKRLADLGDRTSKVDRDTFRLVVGANGNITDKWHYEVSYVYGQTKEAQSGTGQVNVLNFRNALNAIVDTDDLNENGNTTEIICADATARAQGCVPANIYGFNSLAPAANYLAAPSSLTTKIQQSVASANITGELFSLGLGAAPIGLSFGAEYRREFSSSEFDALTQAGLNAGNALPPTKGRFHVWEGYVETIVPILADTPFFKTLNVRGAIRVSDYSTVGRTFSYNYGIEWAPVEDIRFRATRAQSTRAPNISELYSPLLQDFPTGLQDPCAGITATTTGALADNCRAAPGVMANINANGAFTVTQSDLQGITSYAGGNPNLQEEKGKSWTVGVVINPRSINALRNLTLSVDWFDLKVTDAIVSTPLQFILDQCYRQGEQGFCDFITRRPGVEGANSAGSLDEVNSGASNSGGLRTSGIDVSLTYQQNLDSWGLTGTLGLNVAYTHLLKGYAIPLPGSDKDYFAGEVGASKDRFTANLNYSVGSFGVTFTGTYIGKASLDDQLTGAKPGTNPFYEVGSQFYLDTQLRYSVGDNYEFYIGADNIFDNKAPFIPGTLGGDSGISTLSGVYDVIGRKFYAGARLKF
ncbi:MAG: TonB-dependent receptor [Sphingobium sp.]